MNTAPLSLQAFDFKGAATTIMAQQTGADTLVLHLLSGSSNTYTITNVRRVGEGIYEGETSVFMQSPHIRLEVGPTSITITVTHTWWNPAPVKFLVSPAKAADVNAWLDGANFPPA